jgi:hypothetical protein
MSTYISDVFFRDRVCPGCNIFKTIDQFNKKTIRCRQCSRKYYLKNKEQRLLSNKNYRNENKEQRRLYGYDYSKAQYTTNPSYKLSNVLRSRIRVALKKNYTKKADKTVNLLGCTIIQARTHIESLFEEGMSWNNHGTYGWHIDHIKPINTFDLTDIEQQKQCFNYTNLRPLWAKDNLARPDDGSDISVL